MSVLRLRDRRPVAGFLLPSRTERCRIDSQEKFPWPYRSGHAGDGTVGAAARLEARFAGQIFVHDQHYLASGMAFLDFAVSCGPVFPVAPATDIDRERTVVEPPSHRNQAAAARLSVVAFPAHACAVGIFTAVHRGGYDGTVASRPGGPGERWRCTYQHPFRTTPGKSADLVRPV